MCSVVGYIGANSSKGIILEGLSRLEYRGYDSAGYACFDEISKNIIYAKAAGQLSNLIDKLAFESIDGSVGIGHTRWATHGIASEDNAHPHFDCEKTIAVVHNGIIENHHSLAEKLKKEGHSFCSDTDTEVVAHLLEALCIKHETLKASVLDLVSQLDGAYSCVCLLKSMPDCVVAVRKRSPLCIGFGNGEMFIASDPFAFAGKTDKVLFLPDESFAFVTKDGVELYDFFGTLLPLHTQTVDITWDNNEKNGHEHFMLKEIYEQKGAIRATVDYLAAYADSILNNLDLTLDQIKNVEKVVFIGCGASWFAASIAQFFFEEICGTLTASYLASEFKYKKFFPEKNTVYLFVSQSGETADTLEAMRLVNSFKLPTIALTNVASSSMVRESNGFLLTRAGVEVAVASTKAFSTQLAALYWFAHFIAHKKDIISSQQVDDAYRDILLAAEALESSIERYKHVITTQYAQQYASYTQAICLGRHVSYPFALEAALKFKEIGYIFTQCYPAGELKHGPLALVEKGLPVFIFSHQDPLIYQKLLANTQEVKARGGHVVAFAFEGQDELCELADVALVVPRVKPLLGPLAMTGVMQFFVYSIAKQLGRPIDKPRNLAKSVTVE